MTKSISAQGITLAILGAALAASGAAHAAESGGAPRIHERGAHHAFHHHHGHHGHHKGPGFHHGGKGMHHGGHHQMHRAGLIVPGYGVVSRDFVDGMGLNADQLKLIDNAREAAKALRENRREAAKAERGARLDLFKADSLDPEQAMKQAEERRATAQAERRQLDEKWVAVWKSLDTGQQARVATHLKDRAEKAQKRAEKFEARRQQREAGRTERGERAAS